MNQNYLFIFIFFVCSATAHSQTDAVGQEQTEFLSYKNSRFSKNYQGIENFMQSLKYSNDTMAIVMEPTFSNFKQKRKSGKILGFTGLGIGAALMVGTAISTNDNDRFESSNATGYIGGAIVMGAGALIYHLLNVREKDIKSFVNEFNTKSPKGHENVTLTAFVGPSIQRGLPGLAVHITFK